MNAPYRFCFLGLSITSSWGNGHATTYRGLVRELAARGHEVLFLERDTEWYAAHRDLPQPPYGRTALYRSLEELRDRYGFAVREADVVILGSYVPEGIAVGAWIAAAAPGLRVFYDIDTPVTLSALARGDCEYFSRELAPRFDLYLSFTGGPVLKRIEREFGAPLARPLYCSADPRTHHPEQRTAGYDLGYLGTYSADRQPALEALLLEPARRMPAGRFAVAGPMYPPALSFPSNVTRIDHLAPNEHKGFYNSQRFTLNVTRADMVRAGYSPSVRLFEAAACATPVISDCWEGLDSFFQPGREILLASGPSDTLHYLTAFSEEQRLTIGERARLRVMAAHTAAHRVSELEAHLSEAMELRPRRRAA